MKFSKSLGLIFSAMLLLFIFGCDGGGGSDSGGTGTLSVSLTDAAGSYKAVYITVESVEVHTGGNDNNDRNWQTIPMDIDTINLCELTNGLFLELGSLELSEGKYNQLRLHLNHIPEDGELNILSEMHPHANYVILEDNTVHELTVPSGFQSGVKIVKGFTINANGTTEIILDFDAMSSVVEAGNSDKWILKPTIKVGELDEYSIINGRVTDDADELNGIAGAYVSAQIFNPSATDEKDKVVIHAGTITDEQGYYSLFVMPNTYNLVAYIDGKEFESIKVYPDAGQELKDTDFELVNAIGMGTVKSDVSINGADENEQYATISYRKEVYCPDQCEMIEVKSINLINNTLDKLVDLPLIEEEGSIEPNGSYRRVASTFGYKTQSEDLEVIAGSTIDDNIELTEPK